MKCNMFINKCMESKQRVQIQDNQSTTHCVSKTAGTKMRERLIMEKNPESYSVGTLFNPASRKLCFVVLGRQSNLNLDLSVDNKLWF